MENIKIWCNTIEERDAVLAKMEEEGVNHSCAIENSIKHCIIPIAIYVNNGISFYGQTRAFFEKDISKEISVKEFLGKPKCTKQIHITTDGTNTYAVLKENGKVMKRSSAKCSPEDEFSFDKGSRIALNRLLSTFVSNGYINAAVNETNSEIIVCNATENAIVNIAISLLQHTSLGDEFVEGLDKMIVSQYKAMGKG